ncbi:MAG TPA: extracellular solute-binding protein, partial [Phototrophicaceae bacterium]|nr:extracellular solute-binding protein [Phototrophicaceae bacterium]
MKKLSLMLTLLLLSMIFVVSVPAVSAQDTIEISFVHIFGGEQDTRGAAIQEIADAFMAENPNIKVTVTSTSTDYTELFNAALLASQQGSAPSIVQVEEGLTQLAADSGLFTAISDLASEEQLASLDDVLPVVRNYYTISDKIWSVPWNSSNPLLYYNRDMFTAAGLDPDTPPTTFEEVTAACDAIMAKKDELKITACINFPMVTWFAEQWVAMQGGLVANNDNGRTARANEMMFNSPEMLNVINWFKVLADQDYYTY